MKEKIKELIRDIRKRYGLDAYMLITGDYRLRCIPNSLCRLIYSNGAHKIAICNLDYFYSEYMDGIITDEELLMMLSDLSDALAQEFKNLSLLIKQI